MDRQLHTDGRSGEPTALTGTYLLEDLRRVFWREGGGRGRGGPAVVMASWGDAADGAASVVVALQRVAVDGGDGEWWQDGQHRTRGTHRRAIPVHEADGFVDGHTPAALFGLAVSLVFGVHVLLGEIAAHKVKMCRVEGDELRVKQVLHLELSQRERVESTCHF